MIDYTFEKIKKDNIFKDKKLLIVEDNEINRDIVIEAMTIIGMRTEVACNGKEAVEIMNGCQDNEYYAVLMDIEMPVMNGYEATRQIRESKREYLRNVPVIAISANCFEEDIEAYKDAGMNGHITKPMTFNEVIRVLMEYAG